MTQFLAQLLNRSARDWEALLLAPQAIDNAMADARRKQDQAFALDLERLKTAQS